MKRAVFPLVIVSALLVGAQASAEPARADVERALSGYENAMKPEQFRRLGEDWDRVVERIVLDPAARPILRIRGLGALAHASSPSAAATVRKVLAAKGQQTSGVAVLEAREALRSLAVIEPFAVPEFTRYLEHAVPDMRVAAVRALARRRTVQAVVAPESRLAPEARVALEARLAREQEPMVRHALREALEAR